MLFPDQCTVTLFVLSEHPYNNQYHEPTEAIYRYMLVLKSLTRYEPRIETLSEHITQLLLKKNQQF